MSSLDADGHLGQNWTGGWMKKLEFSITRLQYDGVCRPVIPQPELYANDLNFTRVGGTGVGECRPAPLGLANTYLIS
jgi:hypothetical protein